MPEPLSCFAVAAPGLEALVAAELRALGIPAVEEAGGAAWEGTAAQLRAANLHARVASRVLVRVAEFRARTFYELERHAGRVPWERWVAPGREVSLRVTCRKSRLYHQRAVAERVMAAVEARAGGRAAGAEMEEEAEGTGAQLFVVRFHHDVCTVSVDASGALLHLRGYRQAVAKAPLRETLAAALLAGSGWRGDAPLLDPMCGSGTIPIEAALLARRIAPGLASPERAPRRYAFLEWPEHDAAAWGEAVARAREEILPAAPAPVLGSDRDEGAIAAAAANAARAGVGDDLDLSVRALSAVEPPPGPGWLVTNPPYGVRVGEAAPLRNLYAALGRLARERLPGWTVGVLTAEPRLTAQLGLPLEERLRTSNGGIPVRLGVALTPRPG